MDITIDQLRKLCTDDTMMITHHAQLRCRVRGIALQDIHQAIEQGEIIEQYPEDAPYPSCLLLGYSNDKPLHIVAGASNDMLWIITVYCPNASKWEADFKTRKAVS